MFPVFEVYAAPFRTDKIHSCMVSVGLSFIMAQVTLAGKSCVI